MIYLDKLTTNNEYYFLTSNCLCAGFFEKIENNKIYLRNGSYFFNNDTYHFDSNYIEISDIISVATV